MGGGAAEEVDDRELWMSLGVQRPWLDILCEIKPVYRGARLYVSAHLEGAPDGRGKIKSAILRLWRFNKLTKSRRGP